MDISNNNIGKLNNEAMEALKRAFEESTNTTARSYIMIAFNAIIKMENELNKTSKVYNSLAHVW